MTGDVTSGAVSGERLGSRVRGLRRVRGLTLEALAAASGVSRAMISKVERGEKNPTLVVAARLAAGLGVSLSRLAGTEERSGASILRRGEQAVTRDPETGYERRLLSPLIGGPVEFVRDALPEGARAGDSAALPDGVEAYVAVAEGEVLVFVGGEEHLLAEGDALHLDAGAPCRFENAGVGSCAYYVVILRRGAGR